MFAGHFWNRSRSLGEKFQVAEKTGLPCGCGGHHLGGTQQQFSSGRIHTRIVPGRCFRKKNGLAELAVTLETQVSLT